MKKSILKVLFKFSQIINGGTYNVSGSIEEFKEFYEANKYDVLQNGNTLSICDHVGRKSGGEYKLDYVVKEFNWIFTEDGVIFQC